MLLETPFHPRTATLCHHRRWRNWSGYAIALSYEPSHEYEYYAVRSGTALFDISPLRKYEITGTDAAALVDRIVTRNVADCPEGRVLYSPWCDEAGKLIDDGTIQRLDADRFRITAADPCLRWFQDCGLGMDASVRDISLELAALALQGPTSRDILARLIDGARISLLVGLAAVVIAAILGTTLGLIAGYVGGRIDTLIISAADVQMAFPGVLAGLILVAAFGPSVWLVIVFFDEMESLFRMRGSGISSDMESTVVPQLLAEIDGVEALRNVIVIGASNREVLIDPAILRPGRLDVKIKIERPDAEAAAAIFSRYLTVDLPIAHSAVETIGGGERDKAVRGMIEQTVAEMYSTEQRNEFLEVTYQNGDKETMYFRDFASGAMVENIVRRAKKLAIKRVIAGGPGGITLDDLLHSVGQEHAEHEDLPNTTNPDDWAKIAGKKGERITFVRTLVHRDDTNAGGRSIERVATGQYL